MFTKISLLSFFSSASITACAMQTSPQGEIMYAHHNVRVFDCILIFFSHTGVNLFSVYTYADKGSD